MARYLPGQVALLTSTFTDEDGILADPDNVTVSVTKPDGTIDEPAAFSQSTGVWEATILLDQVGLWFYLFTGSGTVDAIDQGTIVVRELKADLLTPTQLRQHVSTGLDDDALQRLLDANEEAIEKRAGSPAAFTEYHLDGGKPYLIPTRPVGTVTSIVENGVTLDATDYRIRGDGYWLERLDTGTHPSTLWSHDIVMVYSITFDIAERIRVLIALCKQDIEHNPGKTSETVGDWSETYASNSVFNYAIERENILGTLDLMPAMAIV